MCADGLTCQSKESDNGYYAQCLPDPDMQASGVGLYQQCGGALRQGSPERCRLQRCIWLCVARCRVRSFALHAAHGLCLANLTMRCRSWQCQHVLQTENRPSNCASCMHQPHQRVSHCIAHRVAFHWQRENQHTVLEHAGMDFTGNTECAYGNVCKAWNKHFSSCVLPTEA